MNAEQLLNGDLEPVLLTVIDGTASDADFASLVEALRESEQLRRRACLFLCDDALLADEIGAAKRASKLVEMLSQQAETGPPDRAATTSLSTAERSWPLMALAYVNRRGLAVAAAAALVIAGLLVHNLVIMSKISRLHSVVVQGSGQGDVEVVVEGQDGQGAAAVARPGGGVTTAQSGTPDVVGRVIGLSEAHWRPGEPELTFGSTLQEGQRIQLASGAFEVLLANGAKITAVGPVDFELSSLVKMDLDMGKIVAAVPRTARGYTVVTPTSELVDIGTQFGVAVASSGDTELHVFDGDVVARSRVDKASTDLLHAKENEAIGFDSANVEPRRFAAEEEGFVRRLGPEVSADEIPPLPRTENLCLWYAADMIRDAKPGDSVSIWRDLLAGDNNFANDARQFDVRRCPTLADDEQGRPMLRFNGWSTTLQIDPLENSGCYTAFIVCAPGPTSFANVVHGGMLFKHGEAPSLELSVMNDFSARSWVWPGHGKPNVGVVKSRPLAESRTSLLACQYDSTQSASRMWLNGVQQDVSNAPVELHHCAPAYLGSHSDAEINAYFFGSIYEVVVYDAAVDVESMEAMNSYFFQRYAIERADQ